MFTLYCWIENMTKCPRLLYFPVTLCMLLNIHVVCVDSYKYKVTPHYEIALQCYACYGIGAGNACERYESYQKAWYHDEISGPVTLKTCSEPFNKMCIIETFTSNSGETAHIRDCSDGKTFDFTELTHHNITAYQNLTELAHNNETLCEEGVCLTKCGPNNFASFCNGPQSVTAMQNRIYLDTSLFWLMFIAMIKSLTCFE